MRSRTRMAALLALLVVTALLAAPASGQSRAQSEAERIASRTQALAQKRQTGRVVEGRLPSSPSTFLADPLDGRWNSSCRLPDNFNLIHATVMRDGNVVAIAGSGNVPGGALRGYIFFPDTCEMSPISLPDDFFCHVHVPLPGGKILMAGGTKQYDPFQGLRVAYLFDPATRDFARVPSMAAGRWYPGATQLGNGNAIVFSGLDGTGALNTRVETYSWSAQTWSLKSYRFRVPTYAHMLPTSGGRLFFTGMAFGGSNRAGFLQPSTGGWQSVSGVDPTVRNQGASFFVPRTQGRTAMIVGGGVASSAIIDLYASNPAYRPGPSLARPTRFLNHAGLFDGKVLLAGGQDNQGNPVSDAYLYRPGLNVLDPVTSTSFAHQYHSVMWVDRKGRAWLGGGNPMRGVEQPVLERFDPWYVDVPDRPAFTSAPTTITRNQAFTVSVRLAEGTSLSSLRLHRLASVTHQHGAAEGDFALARSGSGWVLNVSANLTPPGHYYLVATDSRDVPSVAKIVRVKS